MVVVAADMAVAAEVATTEAEAGVDTMGAEEGVGTGMEGEEGEEEGVMVAGTAASAAGEEGTAVPGGTGGTRSSGTPRVARSTWRGSTARRRTR